MCNKFVYDFVKWSQTLWPANPNILEVGSYNVNGSPRDVCRDIECTYLGVDIAAGSGVDQVCAAEDLPCSLPPGSFDVVISTEMLEHVGDWQASLLGMVRCLKLNGLLVLTTVCPGFEYHPYPQDNWRFTLDDMYMLFSYEANWQLYMLGASPDLRRGKPSGVGIVAKLLDVRLVKWTRLVNDYNVMNVHDNPSQVL